MRDPVDLSRRHFLELIGAGVALTAAGCSAGADRRIVPYARQPPEVTPGVARVYATTMTLDGYGTGLLAQSREGRPVKIEGNPEHPASLGASGVLEQASVLGLYDPFRARHARRGQDPASWEQFAASFGAARPDRGAGLRLLLEPTASPLRGYLLDRMAERLPESRVYFHSGVMGRTMFGATRRVLGRALTPRYDLRRATVVAAFGANPLDQGPFHLRHARDFADRRRDSAKETSRWYVAEPAPTPTGTIADHRMPARPSELGPMLARLFETVIGQTRVRSTLRPELEAWISALAEDLRAHRGAGLVMAGEHLSEDAHVLAIAVNAALGNDGRTVLYAAPVVREAGAASHDLSGLVSELRAGHVDTLVVLEGNPAFASSGDLGFADAQSAAAERVYLGLYEDETAATAKWFVPAAHYLESWGDARAYDGTISIVQPLVKPLYEGHTADEVLAIFAGLRIDAHALVRQAWASGAVMAPTGEAFEGFWRDALRRGLVSETEAGAVGASADLASAETLAARMAAPTDAIEVSFHADPRLHDGRFANNPWLLELPDPITKLTWDNAALLSPSTAQEWRVESGDLVDFKIGRNRLRIPVLPTPGHVDGAVSVALGFGRRRIEGPGAGVGADGFAVRASAAPWSIARVERVRNLAYAPFTGKNGVPARRELAVAQTEWSSEGRDIARRRTVGEFRPRSEAVRRAPATFYDPPHPQAHEEQAAEQWAMTIDLGSCTGCSACVVACQAENNVPVVGREGVARGRLMHWLRIDRYVERDGSYSHQPMLCQHCEKAPCEYVCPVNATVHSADGLNEMVYNRCVGTRFCSNNCPYKVRRFNWFDYNEDRTATEALVLNPDVTVRERGVMEKCTYCVQRIRRSEIEARRDDRALRDDDVVTACQQACPTRAIVFGSLTREDSAVARSRQDSRLYAELDELDTQPRTRYLVRLTNPNRALSDEPKRGGGA
jgi:Fe-S-cluster-containing dehydrogenase component/anaerobic selenocysteine-containing dehydrogenase